MGPTSPCGGSEPVEPKIAANCEDVVGPALGCERTFDNIVGETVELVSLFFVSFLLGSVVVVSGPNGCAVGGSPIGVISGPDVIVGEAVGLTKILYLSLGDIYGLAGSSFGCG
jgi:hypothetical protein